MDLGRDIRGGAYLSLVLALSLFLLPMLAAEVTKVYVFAGEDVSIMAPPELADKNWGQDEYLVSGYVYRKVEHCSSGNKPCLVYLENQPAITLLKFKIPQTKGDPSSVELLLPSTYMEYDLPSSDLSDLCRFSVSLVDVPFSESEVTWEELSGGNSWNPEDHLSELGTFYVTPSNSTPLVLDLTDHLKGMIKAGAEIKLAIAPSPLWWNYNWDEWMGCSIYMSSSEGNGAPALLIEYGKEGSEEAPLPFPIVKPWAIKLPEIPFNVGGGGQEPIPLPKNLPKEIPKLQPKVEPPPDIPKKVPKPPEGSEPPAQGYPQTFSLMMHPDLLSVGPGASATFTVEVVPHYGFSDWVSLEVKGGPSGSEIQLIPSKVNPVAATNPEAKVVVKVPEWTPPGNYLVKVSGKSGELGDSASAWLQVKSSEAKKPQPQPKEGDFYLLTDSPHYSTVPGRAVTIRVKVKTLAGFSAPVDLSLSGLPPNSVYITHNSPVEPGGMGIVRILPSKEAPTGGYKLMIVGTSDDLTRSVETVLHIGSATSTTTGTSMAQGSPLELTLDKYTLETETGVPVRTRITVSSGQQGKISLEYEVSEGVEVQMNKSELDPGDSTLIYLAASAPGNYEVRLRASQLGAKDEKVLRLIVKEGHSGTEVTGPRSLTSRTSRTQRATEQTQRSTETAASRLERIGATEVMVMLLALIAVLLIILIILARRRS